MSSLAFVGATAVLPNQLLDDATVVCKDNKIVSVGSRVPPPTDARVIDVSERYLCPGFIDIHVHGGDGADFMDGTPEAVETVCNAHARHGTTTIFPTTTTGAPSQILAMLSACRSVAENVVAENVKPKIGGVHLYGPFFAADKVGCHSLDGRRSPTSTEYDEYFETGQIKIATCAAELPGADQFFRAALAHSCLITCGHSNASWAEMQLAFDNGMRHVDHFWCAMSSVASLRQRFSVPMQASMAEFVLMHQDMSTEVIADGWHLAPELLEFAYRMKGASRLCLVTDCNRALDMPPGDYRFGNVDDGSWLYSDGKVGWAPDRGSLASSIVGMDHMMRHIYHSTSATLPCAVRMASLTPAERTGIADQTGSIEAGKSADLVLLDKELQIASVFVNGEELTEL